MDAYDITHGVANISNFNFLKSPTVFSSLEIYLRATYDISHGLEQISSLKFLKSPSFEIFLRATYDITHGLQKYHVLSS